MKKFAFIIPALLLSQVYLAQDSSQVKPADEPVLNKKGREILPAKGDIALGFNSIPFLNMVLSVFNPAANSSADNIVYYTSNSNNQITGKYFLTKKTAIRVRFGFNTLSGSITNKVRDAEAIYKASFGTSDDIAKASMLRVEDKVSFSKNNWMLSAGYEIRRGYRRLQGFYGAEFGIGNNGSSQKVTYGNDFSATYDVEYTSDFNSLQVSTQEAASPGRTTRLIKRTNTGGIRLGLRAFIGIEYFIFSKISIAAEYGWGYSISTRRAAHFEQEVYNNGQNGREVFSEKVNTDSREVTKGFSVDNNNGNIFSMNNTLGGNTALSGGAGALTLLFHF